MQLKQLPTFQAIPGSVSSTAIFFSKIHFGKITFSFGTCLSKTKRKSIRFRKRQQSVMDAESAFEYLLAS